MEGSDKDGWDKAEILLKPVGALVTAAVVAYLGFLASSALDRRRSEEEFVRTYIEEAARDARARDAFRQAMFEWMAERFEQTPSAAGLDERFLALDLFAVNFHETFDLSPLLNQMRRDMAGLDPNAAAEAESRLYELAYKIRARELQILDAAGAVGIPFMLPSRADAAWSERLVLQDETEWRFEVRVAEIHPEARTLTLEMDMIPGAQIGVSPDAPDSRTVREPGSEDAYMNAIFDVDPFKFPMSQYASLPSGVRCSVMMDDWDTRTGEAFLQLLCYPGDFRSAMKAAQLLERMQGLPR
jgi:hypothetical protein